MSEYFIKPIVKTLFGEVEDEIGFYVEQANEILYS